MRIETKHMTAKGIRYPGHLQSDMAPSDDAERFPKQLVSGRFTIGSTGARFRVSRDHSSEQRDHQSNSQLTNGMDCITCGIVDSNSQVLARFLVHMINPCKSHTN